jgi:hypothetical protein
MDAHRFGTKLVTAFAAGLLALSLTANAAEQKPYCSGDPVVNKLDKSGAKALADWLKDNDGQPAPMSFKVPGLATTRILCKLNAMGLRCFEVLEVMRCPEAVDVDTPNGTSTVPVDCTGPDANGECDCDFAQG